jgi:hypothetical protein
MPRRPRWSLPEELRDFAEPASRVSMISTRGITEEVHDTASEARGWATEDPTARIPVMAT